jgi:hypothetical protein
MMGPELKALYVVTGSLTEYRTSTSIAIPTSFLRAVNQTGGLFLLSTAATSSVELWRRRRRSAEVLRPRLGKSDGHCDV